MMNIAVFASGSGTNFQAIVNAVKKKKLDCNIAFLLSDRADAKALIRAKEADIPGVLLVPKEFENKEAYEQEVLHMLQEAKVDFIVLAGYMRLIGETLLKAYTGRIVNIHPSLLPKFPGKDAIGQAMEAGVSETGVTIHLVDEGMDTGPIIAQRKVAVTEGMTRTELTESIQKVEHELYPKTLANLLTK